MMKPIKNILIILIILSACKPSSKDPRIAEFEEFLGPEKVTVINDAVLLLDSMIAEKSFQEGTNLNLFTFFEDLCFTNPNWNEFYNKQDIIKLKEQSKLSGLDYELRISTDTVYSNEEGIVSVYSYIPKDNTTDSFKIEMTNLFDFMIDTDSLSTFNELKQSNIFNYSGKYISALELIQANDTFLKSYIDAKKNDMILPCIHVNNINYLNVDYNDYFVKRIIAIEFLL